MRIIAHAEEKVIGIQMRNERIERIAQVSNNISLSLYPPLSQLNSEVRATSGLAGDRAWPEFSISTFITTTYIL